MVLGIINVCISKNQDFINGLKRRLLSIPRIHQNSPANCPALFLPKNKTMRLPPNLPNDRVFPINDSNISYDLVKRNLTSSAAMEARRLDKLSSAQTAKSELQIYKESHFNESNTIMKEQINRLKRKGVMKDLDIKTPEAITGLQEASK